MSGDVGSKHSGQARQTEHLARAAHLSVGFLQGTALVQGDEALQQFVFGVGWFVRVGQIAIKPVPTAQAILQAWMPFKALMGEISVHTEADYAQARATWRQTRHQQRNRQTLGAAF